MARDSAGRFRWVLVFVAALALGVAGTYQFVWSSLRVPLASRTGASEAALGTVFTAFVAFQTLSQFPAGWVRDRWGPRWPLAVGATLLAGGYLGVATADSVAVAILAYSVGGIGVGAVYTVAVNTPVKWFTDRRGLATGIVSMAYGGTSFLLIPAIRQGVADDFRGTLVALGALVGVVPLAAIAVLRDPEGLEPSEADVEGHGDTYTWREAIRTWQFWLLYGAFVVVNGVGLMVIGKAVSFAQELGLSPWAATASASLVALADAVGLVVVGGLSDRFDRERTMGLSLVLSGLTLAGCVLAGAEGLAAAFVVLIAAAAFFRSPAFAIVPTLVGEYYGPARSSENYAALYTAKLWGGVFGGVVASALVLALGWSQAFLLGAGAIATAGVGVSFLRPV